MACEGLYMVGSNLPDNVTPGDVDRAMDGPKETPPAPEPSRPECVECGQQLPWKAHKIDNAKCGEDFEECSRKPDGEQ